MGSSRRKHSKRYAAKYRYQEKRGARSSRRSRSLRISVAVLLVLFVALLVTKLRENTVTADNIATQTPERIPKRIVSLAPSITETLFVLGADSLLVGVTQYCKFPAAADTLPEVGGFLDPNLEALLALEPDLVILLRESGELADKLRKLGLQTLSVNHQTVDGILESYSSIGAFVGQRARGDSISAAQSARLQEIQERTENIPRPTALVSIGHSDQPGVIKSVYVTGRDDFYSALLEIAGGTNVISDSRVRYPVYDVEGITALNPDYILDIFPGGESEQSIDRTFVLKQWASLSDLNAVRQNRVIVLEGTHMVIPGPRMLKITEAFLAALHPQIAAELSLR